MEYKDGEGEVFTYKGIINLDETAHFTIGPKGEIQKMTTPNHNQPCTCADCRWTKRRAPKEKLILSWHSDSPTKLKMLVTGKWVTLSFDTLEECVAVIVVLHHTYEVYAQ